MQVGQPDDDVLVNLHVSLFQHSLLLHHVNQVFIPAGQFLLLLVGSRIRLDDILADAFHVAAVGTNQVLHLPHIQQVFGDILFFKLLRNIHILSRKRFTGNGQNDSHHRRYHDHDTNNAVEHPDAAQIKS